MSTFEPTIPLKNKSGTFEWTAGQSYKTSLGGSFSTSVGQSTAVTAAIDNKLTLGTANSLKWAAETAVTFGKKFEYKDVEEIDFKKGSISILEFSGARCLDLFQASAGLGTIQRAAFDAQRATAKTAMKVMVACDFVLAVSNVTMSGFGQGFTTLGKPNKEKGTEGAAPSFAEPLTWCMTGFQTLLSLAPVLFAFCSDYLTSQQKTTKPATWNPNAIVQTSTTKGVFIGSAPQSGLLPPSLASFILQNDQGTNWTVFKTVGVPPMLLGENVGLLDKQQHITGFDMTIPVTKSSMNMTEEKVSLQTGTFELNGLTGPGSLLRTGSAMNALFASIDLTAQPLPGAKTPPNANLSLNASADPTATLSAGVSPALSSVTATGTALNLKSGTSTSLVMNATSATITAPQTAKIVSYDSVAVNGMQVKITGVSGVTIAGALVRLG